MALFWVGQVNANLLMRTMAHVEAYQDGPCRPYCGGLEEAGGHPRQEPTGGCGGISEPDAESIRGGSHGALDVGDRSHAAHFFLRD